MKYYIALLTLLSLCACSRQAQQIETFVAQSVPTQTSFGFDKNLNAIAIRNGKQQLLGFSNEKMTRHVQSGNDLFSFNMLQSQEVTRHSSDGRRETIQLEISGPLFFLESVASGFIGGSFLDNRIFLYGMDKAGKIMTSEIIEAEPKQILYTNGHMYSAWTGEQLHLWVPAYNKYFVLDETLALLEHQDLPFPAELIAFDGNAMPQFFDANENLSLEELRAYAQERIGTILQVRPMGLFVRDQKSFFLYSLIVIGEGLNHEGKPDLKYITRVLDINGTEVMSEDGDALCFYDNAIAIQYMVKDIPHRKFVTL